MLHPPLLEGLRGAFVDTRRLRTHIIAGGPEDGAPVIFIHGNCSAARFWEETMVALPAGFRAIAPDMRGYGRSETAPVDATRGVRDFSDDLRALIEKLDVERPHLVGWSLGGCVVMQYTIDHPADVASLTLIAPGSPYGYGGTRDIEGTPASPDFAGSGGGAANPDFVRRMAEKDRSGEHPLSPRNVMNAFYFRPPFRSPREEIFVDELLTTVAGDANYPGNALPVSTWPGVAPGTHGVNNALSPKYCNLAAFADITPKPPVLWVRGDSDSIVSDTSMFDLGYLGQIGAVPGWPGADEHPPQPMIAQTRAVLDRYRANGGNYTETTLQDCGHSPHVEQPEAFQEAFFQFLQTAR